MNSKKNSHFSTSKISPCTTEIKQIGRSVINKDGTTVPCTNLFWLIEFRAGTNYARFTRNYPLRPYRPAGWLFCLAAAEKRDTWPCARKSAKTYYRLSYATRCVPRTDFAVMSLKGDCIQDIPGGRTRKLVGHARSRSGGGLTAETGAFRDRESHLAASATYPKSEDCGPGHSPASLGLRCDLVATSRRKRPDTFFDGSTPKQFAELSRGKNVRSRCWSTSSPSSGSRKVSRTVVTHVQRRIGGLVTREWSA